MGLRGIAAVALMAALSLVPAAADPVEEFYKGKQITLIQSDSTVGGYDLYARIFSSSLTRHVPGNPAVVIQSMPGAAGIRAMNHLATTAPRDGTTIALVHASAPFAPLYGLEGASYDPPLFRWLGSMNRSISLCVAWHLAGIRTWRDIFRRGFLVGSTKAGSQSETMPAVLNKLFAANIQILSGYKDDNDVYLAMERDEVDGRCGGIYASILNNRPGWFEQRKVDVPILLMMERSPLFPDVPAITDYAGTERMNRILQLILSPQGMDRPLVAPPGVPDDRYRALSRAVWAALNDPGFLVEAKRQKLEIEPVAAERVTSIIRDAYSMPPDIVDTANDAMNMRGGGE